MRLLETPPIAYDPPTSTFFRRLSLDSTLDEIRMYTFQIESSRPAQDLEKAFYDNPLLPGAIVVCKGQYRGMLSRQRFFELISSPYGREVFSRRPVEVMCSLVQPKPLALPIKTSICTATQECWQRPPQSVFEPLVVCLDDNHYGVIDLHDLLLTQSHMYELAKKNLEQSNAALNQAKSKIETLNQQLQAENLRLGAELNVARRMQRMILPKPEELHRIESLDIAGFMESADEVGGDYYDVLDCNGTILMGIGDVTGHGLESGILMVMAQIAIRTLQEAQQTDPVSFFDILNRAIFKNVQRMDCEKNMTLTILNYYDSQLTISGQHEETLIVRAEGAIERIDTTDLGFPLGLTEDIGELIASRSVQLHQGDGAVLYSDGITEAENLAGELYGIERLCKVVSRHWQKPAQAILDSVIADVRRHIGTQKVYDDITLLILKQK